MIFKNAKVRAFTVPFDYTLEELNELLSKCCFKPLEEKEVISSGWVNPIGAVCQVADNYFLASTGGIFFLKYFIEKKDIKKSTIAKKLKVIEDEMMKDQLRHLTKREKIEHEEAIIEELIPHAPTIEKAIYCYISPKDNIIVVNSSQDNDLEAVCALLRKSIGTFPCTIINTGLLAEDKDIDVCDEFTHWLISAKPLPEQIFIGDSCKLVSAEGGKAKSSFSEQDIQTDEMKRFIECGMQVKEICLVLYEGNKENYQTIMSFTINENLDLKSINIFDHVMVENPFYEAEEGAELTLFEGDFLLNVKYINLAFEVMHKAFKTSAKACLEDSIDFEPLSHSLKKVANFFSVQALQVVEEEDLLFEETKEYIVANNSFSISMIQRRFRIGYNRAARLVELVKKSGVEINGRK